MTTDALVSLTLRTERGRSIQSALLSACRSAGWTGDALPDWTLRELARRLSSVASQPVPYRLTVVR